MALNDQCFACIRVEPQFPCGHQKIGEDDQSFCVKQTVLEVDHAAVNSQDVRLDVVIPQEEASSTVDGEPVHHPGQTVEEVMVEHIWRLEPHRFEGRVPWTVDEDDRSVDEE